MKQKLFNHLSGVIRDETHRAFEVCGATAIQGGSINEAFRLEGTSGECYFLKLNDAQHHPMFAAEVAGLRALNATNTLRVPQAIAHGILGEQSYLVLEYLELAPHGDAGRLGEQLAELHRFTSDRTQEILQPVEEVNSGHSRPGCFATPCHGRKGTAYGFAQDNFIGTTPQLNAWKSDWIDFWREQRLGFQLQLAASKGCDPTVLGLGEKLMDALPAFFEDYLPQPSLLHGDLWSGNHAFSEHGTPAIFDPAAYYGDRECDLAMTELFGGFPAAFYAAYRASWPLDEGYAYRRDLYNLYHILNHANLFGGQYAGQAVQVMRRLLSYPG